jgi:hypothetical protein
VLALGGAGGQLPAVAHAEPGSAHVDPLAALDTDRDGTPDRPDSATASQAARKVGERVEDLSQRTPTTQVFANADGTWTTELSGGPVRAQDPSTGEWSPIDTTVAKHGEGWQPASTLGQITFSNGGSGPLVAMRDVDGRDLSWSWPDPLPAPEVEGSTLTYPDVVPHGDLVVKALPGGFSHSVVLRQVPDGPLSLPMLVDTDGADLSEAKDGSLSIKVRRQELVSAPQPMMWDATSDPTDHASIGQAASGQAEPVAVDVAVDTVGDQTRVELAPDPAYLSDPDTEYPVTIDPSYSLSASAALFINSPSLPWLMAGGATGGANPPRSLLAFDGSSVFSAGEHIDSAEFSLYGFSSTDCNPQSMKVHHGWLGFVEHHRHRAGMGRRCTPLRHPGGGGR